MGTPKEGPRSAGIRWGPAEPSQRRQGWLLWVPAPGASETFACLSRRPVEVATHWIAGHQLPCEVPADSCPGCRAGRDVRWQTYFAGLMMPGANVVSIVRVTPRAVALCPQLANLDTDWRGRLIQVSRPGRFPESPIRVGLVGEKHLSARVHEPILVAHLQTLWAGGYRRIGRLPPWAEPGTAAPLSEGVEHDA